MKSVLLQNAVAAAGLTGHLDDIRPSRVLPESAQNLSGITMAAPIFEAILGQADVARLNKSLDNVELCGSQCLHGFAIHEWWLPLPSGARLLATS